VSINRPGPQSNRTVTSNQNPPHSNVNSPLLSLKASNGDNTPLSAKSSAGNLYTSPTVPHRTLSNAPPNSAVDSPSLSPRSTTNTNVYHETNQPSTNTKADSNSLRSADSTSSSEEQIHPSTIHQQPSSTRTQDVSSSNAKHRSQHGHASTSSAGNFISPLTHTTSSSTGTTISSSTGIPIDRIPSPSPSLLNEREREESERVERELEFKRKRLQIYVFICRCVACPFNSKQSSDMARKHLKITLVQYGVIKERFLGFLNGKTHIEADEGKF
jgi:hypothetical protein